MKKLKDSFTDIYKTNSWGSPESIPNRLNKIFYSGGGTDPENDKDNKYINLVQSYVDREDVKTVVEIGCGDWEVSSKINWSTVDYTGYDVVDDLIKYNNQNYSKSNIRFICDTDVMSQNNLEADLIIIKDVIQHLPPKFCSDFVRTIPTKFKYNIITNDFSLSNVDIEFGGYSGNDFSKEPFDMKFNLFFVWQQKFQESGFKITLQLESTNF